MSASDRRVEVILELITRLARRDLEAPAPAASRGDDVDAILVGLRMLGEELALQRGALDESRRTVLQAGKMASVGTLVAMLSHELNNPLSAILLASEGLVRDAEDGEKVRARGEVIRANARRCAELVRAVLAFSHAAPPDRERIDLGELIARVRPLAEFCASRRGVWLKFDLEERLPPLLASATQLDSVILNLVVNACDASPEGAAVRIAATASLRGGAAGIRISVRDDGKGMTPEVLARAFEPFYTTKPVGVGTGLGLSLAKQIVDGLGGSLQLASSPGLGTIATAWLPAAPSLGRRTPLPPRDGQG